MIKKHLGRLHRHTRHYAHHIKIKKPRKKTVKNFLLLGSSIIVVLVSIFILWLATLQIPDLSAFEQRKITQSTKIYDRTGNILLYDIHEKTKRTIVPLQDMSTHVQNATIAIEDSDFYQHRGIKISSIIRAVLANLVPGGVVQGGSTITQQVIKNSVLTKDKTVTRKFKEWVLALKIERVLTKEQILEIYLNESPYGGSIYGVEEASKLFFSKKASDLTLAESAYMAALPQAPTYYSPYGQNKDKLNQRKNLVLQKMLENGFVTEQEYKQALTEKVVFQERELAGIKAPHFVEYVRSYLEEKYSPEVVKNGGLKVITTLDYSLQKQAEEIVKKFALENEKNFGAENAALTALDPQTGDILVMVGSRDYFDKNIQGNFNVSLAKRQPGSAFKPFIYATAFTKGYTPQTALFDVKTEFSSECTPEGKPKDEKPLPEGEKGPCYMPTNYDDKFKGPMTMKDALAQSRNIPAVKTFYLAGLTDSLRTAKDMGISTLNNVNDYGLTLVLGGGEVRLLDITSAYGVFAADGVRHPAHSIIRVEDNKGNVLENHEVASLRVLPENTARQISDILSDDVARTPTFGPRSSLYFPGHDVAAKTGTTNDYRDVWVVGYTPNLVVGAWAGNNDNRAMERKIAGLIITPMWNAFMHEALKVTPNTAFKKPEPLDETLKPVLRGIWQGGKTYVVDSISQKLATDLTPPQHREEKAVREVHSILYWLNKDDPRGEKPLHPEDDSQFESWEFAIKKWAEENNFKDETDAVIPKESDNVHTAQNVPVITLLEPKKPHYGLNERIGVLFNYKSSFGIIKADFYLNGSYVGSSSQSPFSFSFIPSELSIVRRGDENELRIELFDSVLNKGESRVKFIIDSN